MISDINFNMGYKDAYMVLPLRKENGNMKVSCQTPVKEAPQEVMNNLDELQKADTNHDNILSLSELRNFDGKTAFMQSLLESMELYSDNWKSGGI